MVISLIQCLFSPRLYRIYSQNSQSLQVYQPNLVEYIGDFAVYYLIPLSTVYAVWQRKIHYFLYIGVFIITSYFLRSAGRAFNPTYLSFLQILQRTKQVYNTENAELIRQYDFQFKYWPIEYKSQRFAIKQMSENSPWSFSWIAGWLVAHSFGIRLIYPGLLFGPMIRIPLEEARGKFVTEHRGVRNRVLSADGNTLDLIFFDRRNISGNGKTLVICFEGNAGFYEIGILVTPLELGYSILGWNHPGFGGSSGTPYPEAELNAAEAIYDYATNVLGYKDENIILFAWSIGGYPAAYLATEHNIGGLILDATFDDIMPLALPRMPQLLGPLVKSTIRNHVNLHVSKMLSKYKGPLRLIRRTEDEIIADPPGQLTTNRGNNLLIDILRQRFAKFYNNPTSVTALDEWLSKSHVIEPSRQRFVSDINIPFDTVEKLTESERAAIVISIAERIMTDFKSSHCTPLAKSLFQIPWDDGKERKNLKSSI